MPVPGPQDWPHRRPDFTGNTLQTALQHTGQSSPTWSRPNYSKTSSDLQNGRRAGTWSSTSIQQRMYQAVLHKKQESSLLWVQVLYFEYNLHKQMLIMVTSTIKNTSASPTTRKAAVTAIVTPSQQTGHRGSSDETSRADLRWFLWWNLKSRFTKLGGEVYMHCLHKTHSILKYSSVWGPHTKKHIDNTASINRRGCAIHPKLLPPLSSAQWWTCWTGPSSNRDQGQWDLPYFGG